MAAVLAWILAACPGPRGRTPDPPVERAPSGTIVVAYPYEPVELDPFARGGLAPATRDLLPLVFPPLLRRTPDGIESGVLLPGPEPATARRLTWRIDPRARWSDGARITARDVRVTWRRGRTSDPALRHITSLEEQEGGVAITLDEPVETWKVRAADSLVVPAGGAGAWGRSGGPFVLAEVERGARLRFRPNPRAWLQRPRVAELDVVIVPDPATALELFERGRVDVLGPYSSPDWRRRLEAAGARATPLRPSTISLITIKRGPLGTAAVRRALVEALDVGRISTVLVPGGACRAACRDRIAASRDRLDAAGWVGEPVRERKGRRLSFSIAVTSEDDVPALVARAMRRQLARAGINADLLALSHDELWSLWLTGPRVEAAIVLTRRAPAAAEELGAPAGITAGLTHLATTTLVLAASKAVTLPEMMGESPFAEAAFWVRD